MLIATEHVMGLAISAMTALIGWLWREIAGLRRAIHVLEKDHNQHRTHVAERYATKDDVVQSFDRVYAALDRIEKKIDSNG